MKQAEGDLFTALIIGSLAVVIGFIIGTMPYLPFLLGGAYK